MLSKILIPLDGSALAASILPLLQRLAVPPVEVKLLTVLHSERGREEAEEDLEACAWNFTQAGAVVSCLVVTGDPAKQILSAASLWQPHLIAMATHGRSGVARAVRGSVAERVLRASTAPVLLCNPQGAEARSAFEHILVPVDGSKLAGDIIPTVAALARRHGSRISVLQVGESNSPETLSPMDIARFDDSLTEHRSLLEAVGVDQLSLIKATGAPAEEILAIAEREKVDLVAMSTHGRSGVPRWWFGSVAEAVLRTCPLPVLIQPAAAPVRYHLEPPGAFAQARDLMRKDVARVSTDLNVEGFLDETQGVRSNVFPVVNSAGQALGIVSRNDVLLALAQLLDEPGLPPVPREGGLDLGACLTGSGAPSQRTIELSELLHLPLSDLMTTPFVHCTPETPLHEVCRILADADGPPVFVLDDRQFLLGALSAHDLIDFLSRYVSRSMDTAVSAASP
jgi:nucleotide-binding universal stress UspA family protein/predicted transcriptional regulator